MLWWKLQRLKASNPKTRIRAIQELAESHDAGAVEPIAEALRDEDWEVRVAAAIGLGVMMDARGVPSLAAALRDPKPEVRSTALAVLRQLGGERAVDALVGSLADDDHSVRSQAATALNALGWRPSKDSEAVLHASAMGNYEIAAARGGDAVLILAKIVKDTTAPGRAEAATALGKTNDPRAVKPLETALKDTDGHLRIAAIEALGHLGQKESGDALLALVRDENHLARAAAVEALGRIGDARVVEIIGKSLLKDDSWDVRRISVETLGRIGDAQASKHLWQALIKDTDHDVRQSAAQVLGKLRDPHSIGALVLALKDENSSVRLAAKAALRMIDQQWEISPQAESVLPELEAAARDPEYWVAQSAADTLAKIKDARQRALENAAKADKERLPRGMSILVDLLGDFDRDVRLASAEALGRMNDFKAIPSLVKAMDDSDEWVGRAAALALNHLNWSPDPSDVVRAQKMKRLVLQA